MCTLAWGHSENRLWACFNRDEQRSRPRAEFPAIHQISGRPVIYARDPQGGGTWLAASPAGFAVALLNHYPASVQPHHPATRSRGRLVLDLAGAEHAASALARLDREDLLAHAPFCLFLLAVDGVQARDWDGRRLEPLRWEVPFWTTSSYRPDEVTQWRGGWWAAAVEGRELDLAEAGRLMRLRRPEDPAFGLTMDRTDARTLSQAEFSLGPEGVAFAYREREAGGSGFLPPVRLNLPRGGLHAGDA